MTTPIILSIDIGSSSIRCTPYVLTDDKKLSFSIPKCASALQRCSVEPETGRIVLETTTKPLPSRADEEGNPKSVTGISSANSSLWQDIDHCIDETIRLLREQSSRPGNHNQRQEQELPSGPFRVVAIGITSFVMNLVGVLSSGGKDGEGTEEHPAPAADKIVTDSYYTCSYACNTKTVQQTCVRLRETLGETKSLNLYQRTGAPIHTAYALGQLIHIYKTGQEVTNLAVGEQEVQRWTSIASICISNWTGIDVLSMPISYSEASWTGMFDFRSGTWDEECLDLLPVPCRKALPHVGDDIVGEGLSFAYQRRWPEFDKRCKFTLGYGDGACANIGSKCTSMDRIAVTIGTSAAARLLLKLPLRRTNERDCASDADAGDPDPTLFQVPMGLFCYRVDRNHVLLGGALTDGGSVIAWLRELLNIKSDDEYQEYQDKAAAHYMGMVHKISTDITCSSSKVLTFVPFLSGERSTGFRVGATGCITGISRRTTSVDLLQECLQSVILRIHAILDLLFHTITMLDKNARPPCIIASGNALEKNELWRKMLADCSNMNVVLDNDSHEGTSRGAAIMVVNVLSESSSSEIPKEELSVFHTSVPDRMYRDYWHEKKENQNRMIESLESLWM